MKKVISTQNAPKAIGPYSQGIEFGNLIFTSGQLPINSETEELIIDDIKKATKQALDNLKSILEAGNSKLDNVIKTTVFLKDMDDFSEMNEVYGTYFKENPPARSSFQVGKLPLDAMIEIECIAYINNDL